MWSVGCILAELLQRRPLLPGECYLNQLMLILKLVGTPSCEDMANIQSTKALDFLKKLPPKPKMNLYDVLKVNYEPGIEQAVDLLENLLVFNPSKRYSAEQCLEHPFFASLRDPDYEINAGFQFDFDFENKKKPLAKIKGMIFDEMKTFHPSFNEHNPASYNVPILQPEQLYTLDLDGSLIYIDYSQQQNYNSSYIMQPAQQQQAKPNMQKMQQIQENEVFEFLGIQNKDNQMIIE
eukprot:TRINITY_DN2927_c0_g1_i1.p1 TRINITY_DN2927_c0_g1~~TRINITY_DN2927_c0_g1_i1.p1  ORF type:complete len:236 (-),score=40.48 TRINITY_DN2927_c0_g1_i1:122-829(-)